MSHANLEACSHVSPISVCMHIAFGKKIISCNGKWIYTAVKNGFYTVVQSCQ